jgi:quercetin dioxygenase-like cupin family protein
MTKVILHKGAVIPSHDHTHEQTGYIIAGRIELTINGDKFRANPGDHWCILGSIPHSAIAIEESELIEVFSPIRRDYLD